MFVRLMLTVNANVLSNNIAHCVRCVGDVVQLQLHQIFAHFLYNWLSYKYFRVS